VLGVDNVNGTPSTAQLREMQAVVRESMAAGAMGLCCSRSSNHRLRGAGGGVGMTGDLAPGYYATDAELLALASAMAEVVPDGVFQCISKESNNMAQAAYSVEEAIRAEDGTHRGMDWMREIARLGLTVTLAMGCEVITL
jgi:N-acyl-D-aspartate/D-glutamate deacylase